MKTLESRLRDRLTDSRAMAASLDINSNRVLIVFGDIGPLERLVLRVEGNEVIPAVPDELLRAWRMADAEKRSRASEPAPAEAAPPSDEPVKAFFDGENLRAGEGGPLIEVPDDFLQALVAAASEPDDGRSGADAGGAGGSGENDGGSTQPEPVDPDKHSKEELIEMAKATPGAEFSPNDNKATIAAAIDKARGVGA